MTTAADLCKEALTVSGVVGDGQTASGMIINATLARLNRLLAEWQLKRWLVFHLVESTFVCDGAKGGDKNPVLLGPNGDIRMVRPDRIESVFIRQVVPSQPSLIDFPPLEELKAYEDWAAVALKTLKPWPMYFFYDPAMPLGKLYVWPVMSPAGLYEAHILTKEVLGAFTSLASQVLLPPAYEGAITWNLARITRAAFRKPKDEEINALARENLNALRMANAAVPRLRLDDALMRPGIWNPLTDQVR